IAVPHQQSGQTVHVKLLAQATSKSQGDIFLCQLIRQRRTALIASMAGVHYSEVGKRWGDISANRGVCRLDLRDGRIGRLLSRCLEWSLRRRLRRSLGSGRYRNRATIIAEASEQGDRA